MSLGLVLILMEIFSTKRRADGGDNLVSYSFARAYSSPGHFHLYSNMEEENAPIAQAPPPVEEPVEENPSVHAAKRAFPFLLTAYTFDIYRDLLLIHSFIMRLLPSFCLLAVPCTSQNVQT